MRATQSGSRKRAKQLRDHSKNNHAFNKSVKRAPLCGRPAWLALDSIQDCPTARSVGTQEQRPAQIPGILQPRARSLSRQPLTSPGRSWASLLQGRSLSLQHRLLPFSLLGESLSTLSGRPDGAVERAPGQPAAQGLPREARGCLGRLLGAYVGFSNRDFRLQPTATDGPD